MRVWPQVTAHKEPRENSHNEIACSCPFARSRSGRKSPVQPVSTRLGEHAKSIVAWFPGAVHATGNLVDLKLYGRDEFRTEHSNR